MSTVADIVKLLQDASDAYYNGGTLKMDDEAYDSLVERLKQTDPENSYLTNIGAPPPGATKLPYPMPSLDKVKPGEDSLQRFLTKKKLCVVSEKLDGLSALWNPTDKTLYLRGDGIMGQDISHLVNLGIQGLIREAGNIVRGELIILRSEHQILSRSWVNGQVHQKTPKQENISKIHFVAYEVMNSYMTRNQQFEWLKKNKYEVPWYCSTDISLLTETQLSTTLIDRREVSDYDTDGLVIGIDSIPVSESTKLRARNPKDCVAFKMPLADQSAETTVQEVLWASSAQGYIIPRLRFDPVVIGSATIEFCTVHNARTVLQYKLGPGAKVVIRRSGDVIPKLDRVLVAAPEASFPPTGTWVWDGDAHIKVVGNTTEMIIAKMHHFLKTLEIPGAGPATAEALVAAGITGPALLWGASTEFLSKILGPKTGANLYTNLRTSLSKISESTLMQASSMMPRGVGTMKLTSLFAVEADPRKWQQISPPEGWTMESFQNFLQTYTRYVTWRENEVSYIPYPIPVSVGNPPPVHASNMQTVCLSGFRDKELEANIEAKGHAVVYVLSKKVTILLVPDGHIKETEKMKTAKTMGIKILSRKQFLEQYVR